MALLSGGVDYMAIDADKESERLWQPYACESSGTLNLLDAGYFDIDYVSQTAKSGAIVLSGQKAILTLSLSLPGAGLVEG